ncbi:MAG: 4Fe-4S binding protein [Anaerovoracaceae bacterium]
MNIKEIYEEFDKIGSLSFATIDDEGYPQSRIAHFFAYDDEGLYFRTMSVKPFYRELKRSGKVAASGIWPTSKIGHDENNLPLFNPGYTIRISGDIRELTEDEVAKKASETELFNVAVFDKNKYPMTRCFVIYRAKGEIYDYDYAKVNRDHKIERRLFSFGGMDNNPGGLVITNRCVGCNGCRRRCSFSAIEKGDPFKIIDDRCDRCGNCYGKCPSNAIEIRE